MSTREWTPRNARCPCGSGKKYKRCCGSKAPIPDLTGPQSTQSVQQMHAAAAELCVSGQWGEAKKIYEEIIHVDPKEAQAFTGLGCCLTELGQIEPGLDAARRAVELDSSNLSCINELVVMLFNSGNIEESLQWAKHATQFGTEGAKTNVMVANCYEKLHRIEEALEANRLAQIANPNISYLKVQEAKLLARNGDHQRAVDILQATSHASDLQPDLKKRLYSELGRALDKLEHYDQAFDAFTRSGIEATRTPKAQGLSLDLRPNLIKAYVEGLTADRLKKFRPEDLDDGSWTPAFLVGFPRSGTTMTEQILAAHSGIQTTDERPYLEDVRFEWAKAVGPNRDLGWMADQLDVDIILRLRKAYREKVEADQGAPVGSKIVIDKMPLNIINIGLINLIFPEAKIIVALRDPRDCTLSCIMQDFELNTAMVHFLALDKAVRFYSQVMSSWLHFRDIITLSHVTIRYEDTVKNLEYEAKRLINHLCLDWEPDILQFHQLASERVIATPSYVAVTEPVHTRAVGRWKNYRQHFTPLLPMLEPFLKEFEYES